jgi:putative FmdB family regulatory protein
MPLYEYLCQDCGQVTEILVMDEEQPLQCGACQSGKLKKLLSAHAAYSGSSSAGLPGPGDTPCCGTSPAEAGCAGPGSCCGKR